MAPPTLKTFSEGALVAGIERYFFARTLALENSVGGASTTQEDWCLGLRQGSISRISAQSLSFLPLTGWEMTLLHSF